MPIYTSNKMNSRCSYCNLLCIDNRCILCDVCNHWCHFKCTEMNKSQIKKLSNSDEPFFCFICMKSALPLIDLNDNEFEELFETRKKVNNNPFPCTNCGKLCSENPSHSKYQSIHRKKIIT